MGRDYTNAALGTGSIVGFLGSIVVRFLERAELVETAFWLSSLTNLTFGSVINWLAVFFDLFVFCTLSLILLNQHKWRASFSKWNESRRPIEVSAYKGYIWIQFWSHLGEAWPKSVKSTASSNALIQAAMKGELKLWGCPVGKYKMEVIPPSMFRGSRLQEYETTDAHTKSLVLISSDGEQLFSGLTVDKKQVCKLWPSAGREGFIWAGGP